MLFLESNHVLLQDLIVFSSAWHLVWMVVRFAFSQSSKKYAMGVFQLTHSFAFIYEALWIGFKKYQGVPISDDTYYYMMILSMAYFIYDNFGKPFPTVYTLHHIMSVIALFSLSSARARDVFVYGMLMFELSNLPLFYGYMLRHTEVVDKDAVRNWDFVTLYVYSFFRLFMYLFVFLNPVLYEVPAYFVLSFLWYLPGIIWAKKMEASLYDPHLV